MYSYWIKLAKIEKGSVGRVKNILVDQIHPKVLIIKAIIFKEIWAYCYEVW